MSIVDASAQGFLDRVKKTVKKEVENRVNNLFRDLWQEVII